MRLLCDEMLGKLARWLRLLGHDTAYVQHVEDDVLLDLAAAEGRLLLTRDAALAARAAPGQALRVAALEPEAQLREVADALGLGEGPGGLLSRCSVCNEPLAPAAEEAVAGEVPPSVRASRRDYWRCARCRRVYWHGTHTERIEAQLRDLLEAREEAGASRGAQGAEPGQERGA